MCYNFALWLHYISISVFPVTIILCFPVIHYLGDRAQVHAWYWTCSCSLQSILCMSFARILVLWFLKYRCSFIASLFQVLRPQRVSSFSCLCLRIFTILKNEESTVWNGFNRNVEGIYLFIFSSFSHWIVFYITSFMSNYGFSLNIISYQWLDFSYWLDFCSVSSNSFDTWMVTNILTFLE